MKPTKTGEQRLFATREQELLLKAALLNGRDAVEAWESWTRSVDVDGNHDNGSFRLLPLLYTNLQRHGVKHPFMQKLKGIYRHAWYKNERLFFEASKLIRDFQAAGIQTMLLKGAPLALQYYKNHAVRPMADIDVLVRRSEALRAMELLRSMAWKPICPIRESDLSYRHSKGFCDTSGTELDLHWHPFLGGHGDSDREFWKGAVPLKIARASTLAPGPTDTLFHVIIHGLVWNLEPPLRWIPDAMFVIRSFNGKIEWMRLIDRAKKQRASLKLREALNYLHGTFRAPVPTPILKILNGLRISLLEEIEYRYSLSDQGSYENKPFARYATLFCEYLRLKNGSIVSASIGFPGYLEWYLGLKHRHHVFSLLLPKALSHTTRIVLSRVMPHAEG